MAHIDKRIEDYLHLYLGCEVAGMKSGERSVLNIIDETVIELAQKGSIKPILRPLSDMSEEEMEYCEFNTIQNPQNFINSESFSFEQVRYLLSKHFDLFGLIEAGLAIDKTTLK